MKWPNSNPKELPILFFFFISLKKLKEFILDLDISLHQCFELVNKHIKNPSYLYTSSFPTKVFLF